MFQYFIFSLYDKVHQEPNRRTYNMTIRQLWKQLQHSATQIHTTCITIISRGLNSTFSYIDNPSKPESPLYNKHGLRSQICLVLRKSCLEAVSLNNKTASSIA